MSTLSIQNVSSAYESQVILNQLDLTLEQGEIVALLGPSGCGKTTLLRAVAGLQPITHGSIRINGNLLNDDGIFLPSEQRGVGMIFQDYALFPHMTVAQNVLFGVNGLSKAQRQARLEDMLSLVKLDGLGERYPHELSGGQQQRVSIARALAYEPEILLLDEPFSNIDSQVRAEMMLEIRSILKQRNISAVFVTHSKDEAFVFADKLALFKDGGIVQHGIAEELYSQPKDRYVAEFLGAGNYLTVSAVDEHTVDTIFGKLSSSASLQFKDNSGTLLLRPEQFELQLNQSGNGVIQDRRFLGTICHYWVQVEQQILEVKSQMLDLQQGDKVQIMPQVGPLIIF
ncbi:ABC transporter ATP-binding protein [Shewanella maritima]|uniref:ABC transporter ATP-binding protein n=1 Tax=Shewanella maritima TaxID=2520507 RepID=UPI0037354BA3